jgi:hypothetical protein
VCKITENPNGEMNHQQTAEFFVEKPFLSTSNKSKAYQAKHQMDNSDFFDFESTVLQEFVPAGQTIKPVLLHGFATFEEGIPPKIYGITIE